MASHAELWSLLFLIVGVVGVAWLVNRFAPGRRRRIRRLVWLFVLSVVALSAEHATRALALDPWPRRLSIASLLLRTIGWIEVGALLLFSLLLPALRLRMVEITSDLVVATAYLVATIAVLGGAGLDASSVLATSALVGTLVTFSLQNTLQNVFGGVVLQLDDSVQVGDWIQLENGRQGRVRDIRWRHTLVETRDWDTLVIPNDTLLRSQFLILGKRENAPLLHRMWVHFHVDFRYGPAEVVRVVEEALRAGPIEGVAPDPPPSCIAFDLARDGRDSFADYAVRYFLTDLAADDPTSSRVRARIHAALDRAGIPLARPAQTVFLTRVASEDEREARRRGTRVELLRQVPLFAGLVEDELSEVAGRLHEAHFTAGEIVTHHGAVAHWLYILARGRVQVRAVEGSISRLVATLEAPDVFGEMGLLTGAPRGADVVAMTDVLCLRLDKDGFQHVLHHRPELAAQMSHVMAERRVGLLATQGDLDAEARTRRAQQEEGHILLRIQEFFGLDSQRPR